MNDKKAKAEAKQVRDSFWDRFEKALAPEKASKRAYLEELEEVAADAESRIDCVKAELKEEGEDV